MLSGENVSKYFRKIFSWGHTHIHGIALTHPYRENIVSSRRNKSSPKRSVISSNPLNAGKPLSSSSGAANNVLRSSPLPVSPPAIKLNYIQSSLSKSRKSNLKPFSEQSATHTSGHPSLASTSTSSKPMKKRDKKSNIGSRGRSPKGNRGAKGARSPKGSKSPTGSRNSTNKSSSKDTSSRSRSHSPRGSQSPKRNDKNLARKKISLESGRNENPFGTNGMTYDLASAWRRMGRASSMPFAATKTDLTSRTISPDPQRRSQSLDRDVGVNSDEEPPMVMFPSQNEDHEEPEDVSDALRDFTKIFNSLRNRRDTASGGASVDGYISGGSICGSLCGSLMSSSSHVAAELERLKATIERRGSIGEGSKPSRLSLGSGPEGIRGSSVVIAQLELLQRRMNESANGDDKIIGGTLSLAESLVRSGSVRSLNTHENSLMEAFYDPSADSPPYLTIYYATQSGTSEFYAYALQQEGEAMGLDVGICNVSHVIHSIEMSLDQKLKDILVPHTTNTGKRQGRAVFLVSTYQDGGPTDDAKAFVKALHKIKDDKALKGLRYGVFGFGSSTFSASFNSQGKLYDQLLSRLGGKRLVPLALGDDSKDIDWDFEKWKWKSWWPTLADLASRDNLGSQQSDDAGKEKKQKKIKPDSDEAEEKYGLEYISPSDCEQHKESCDKIPLQMTSKHFREGAEYAVKDVKPLWRDPDLGPKLKQSGSTMYVALDTKTPVGTPLDFKTGDSVAIVPHNRSSLVEEVAKQLGYDLDAMFILKPQDGTQEVDFELPFPTPCTVRDYLTKYSELTTPPRRSVIRALSKCATNLAEQEELYQLSSKKHREKYRRHVVGQRIGLGEFISTYYKSVEIPLVKFIEMCAPMQPRWYSLSGSTLMHKDELHLTFVVVSLPRDIDSSYAQGTASHYLGSLPIGGRVQIIRNAPSGLVAPPDPTTPLIMIANGSGIAPMLALIQERHYQRTELQAKVGPTELFFGIRRRDLDFVYRDELREYKRARSLSSLQLACSREQMHKIYVQHLVAKHSEHVWKLLQRGAHIYVCGGTNMSSEVDHVLRAIVSRNQEDSELSTDEFFAKLKEEGRYVQEAFDAVHM